MGLQVVRKIERIEVESEGNMEALRETRQSLAQAQAKVGKGWETKVLTLVWCWYLGIYKIRLKNMFGLSCAVFENQVWVKLKLQSRFQTCLK